jgi:hypothetical protein
MRTWVALGEFVLAYDAHGVNPEQHVDAMPGPLGDLSRIDAAVEPRGQAGMPQVVRPPARGEACSVAVRAAWRALTHARR